VNNLPKVVDSVRNARTFESRVQRPKNNTTPPGARFTTHLTIYLSYDYRKFIVRSTYDSDLKRAEISVTDIVS